MKTGLLERILIRRYGQPVAATRRGLSALCWNPDESDYDSVLYVGMNWNNRMGTRFASLKEIYGDACGGFLIKNTLKVAVLLPRKVYGVWRMDDLQMLPPIRKALEMDPAIDYFMDAYNVYYYGIKAGELFVFDAETDELDCLGPIEPAIETLMDEFQAAGEEVPAL
jgi:hypothetical protein